MADGVPERAPDSGAPRVDRELRLVSSTAGGIYSEPVREFFVPNTLNKYADGLSVPLFHFLDLDTNGDPYPKVYTQEPTTYKSATIAAAAGSNDVWTPGTGKKFRLMGFMIVLAGTAAAPGARTFSIQEETLGAIGIDTGCLAPAAGTGAENTPIVVNLPGNGYLATTANKKLQVVTGTTSYTAGADYITVWGREE